MEDLRVLRIWKILGRGKFGEESPLNQLGGGVCAKGERWSRHKEACSFEQGLAWQMDLEICPRKGQSLEEGDFGEVWPRGFWVED